MKGTLTWEMLRPVLDGYSDEQVRNEMMGFRRLSERYGHLVFQISLYLEKRAIAEPTLGLRVATVLRKRGGE